MTRREFDRTTKENWGYQGAMASDERAAYRARRYRPEPGRDLVTERARWVRYMRCSVTYDRHWPALGRGSKYRNVAAHRAHWALPMLA